MCLVCRFYLTVGTLAVLLLGCASPVDVSYDIIALGNDVGLHRPYENARVYPVDQQNLYHAVLRVLDLRGSQILAADQRSGIVSWADLGSSFIPIRSTIDKDQSGPGARFNPSLPSWRGVVYGAVLIKPFKEQTWLLIKSVGRDRATGGVSFSEGTYERSLLNDVAREAQRNRRPGTIGIQVVAPTLSNPKGTSYSQLYTKHFFNTPEPEPGALSRVGRKEVFPAGIVEVWAACVDVVAQLDTVIRVSPRDWRVIFAHSIAISRKATESEEIKSATEDVNVVFSLHVEPRGPDGASVTLAFLSPDGLTLRPIANVSRKEGADNLKDPKISSTEIAAALVAEELFGKLTTQVFYAKRWQKRLSRRATLDE